MSNAQESQLPANLTLDIENRMGEIAKVMAAIETFCQKHKLDKSVIHKLHIVLDELLSNTIKYGYRDQKTHRIKVLLKLDGSKVQLNIEDDAVPFNPLSLVSPDTKASLKNRGIGGLGIHIVKNLMDDISYVRQAEKNILTLYI